MFPGRRNAGPALLSALFVLAGCSSLSTRDPDLTPVDATAVLETHVVSTGIRDFPVFESTRVSYTRANKRRHELSVRGNNAVAPIVDEREDVLIERLDQHLGLKLDARNRKVTKCPLASCAQRAPSTPEVNPAIAAGRRPDAACRLKVGQTTFSMEPTGRKRTVNGFDAEQYDVKWIVSLRDNASHGSTSTIRIDLWTTPLTPALQDAIALEKTYSRSLDKLLGSQTDAPGSEILPSEAAWMINRYLSASVSLSDRKKFFDGAHGLSKAAGHPVLMHLKWNLAGEACASGESRKAAGDQPLFTFMSEVKVHTIAPLHESLFMPPKGYRVR